jgi:acyl transferase domain-containing protein/acyl carrier protein
MIEAMRHRALPRTLHVERPSTHVDWSTGGVSLLTEPVSWERQGRPRRAGVSSFGVSGTNAHVILEEAPEEDLAAAKASDAPVTGTGAPPPLRGPVPLVLSAKSGPAMEAQAGRIAAQLRANPQLSPADAGLTLAGRGAFEHRAVAFGADRQSLLGALDALAGGRAAEGLARGMAGSPRSLAYLFTGQGSQRPGMGAELHAASPVFAAAFDAACEQLQPHLAESLEGIVFAAHPEAAELLAHTSYAQPALFAIEVALFRLLEAFGLSPQLLAGHSIGEISAAHVAGVLSLSDAAKLVAARGALMGELPDGGAMVAVQASEREAHESIEGREAEVSIAAINAPDSVVLSGVGEAVSELASIWAAKGRKTKRLDVSHAFHSPLIEPMLPAFAAVAEGLDYGEPKIPIVSNLSGEILSAEQAADPAYWVRHAREPVRFADAVAAVCAQGATAFLELGPDGVLSALAQQCLPLAEEDEAPVPVVPALRGERAEPAALTRALAALWAAGVELDWAAAFEGTGARHASLPTYPFQRRRYWLSGRSGGGDASSFGLGSADHPLLGATVAMADGEGVLFTGRISPQSHPWLLDHVVLGAVLLPGTAFLELALAAARRLGVEAIEELVLRAPLVLEEHEAVQVQLSVAEPDEEGRRELLIHSRPEAEDAVESIWTLHASGALAAPGEALSPEPAADAGGSWPPAGAERLDAEFIYDHLAEAGIEYGSSFQGLAAAWRLGEQIFAEASLGAAGEDSASGFGLHPALADAALHALALESIGEGRALEAMAPFSFSDVRLRREGATSLRVVLGGGLGETTMLALDPRGEVVLSIGAVTMRTVDRSALAAVGGGADDALFALDWKELSGRSQLGPPIDAALLDDGEELHLPGVELERHRDLATLVEAIDSGARVPALLLIRAPRSPGGPESGLAAAAGACARRTLELLQHWLGEARFEDSRLVLLTRSAVAVDGDESPDPAQAALWGLLRSAQAEHPGRFQLLDLDGEEDSLAVAGAALASAEPQLAIRRGAPLAPRLSRRPPQSGEDPAAFDPDGTTLIVGGTGGLGALVARHLVEAHGVRHLLLASRSGPGAEGAERLRAELEELGCEVRIAACDASQRDQLERLISAIPEAHGLSAVIHAAGVLDDGVIEALDPERLERVMAPKVDAAVNLDELTAGLGLSDFILFSSAAATIGSPGQGNYAAANAFLDALAGQRRGRGLPAMSLAWGAWQESTGMAAELDEASRVRIARLGIAPLAAEHGLRLFDAARGADRALLLPMLLDNVALRERARAGTLGTILAELVHLPARGTARSGDGSLARRLREMPEEEWGAAVLDAVLDQVAGVVGHEPGRSIESRRSFKELGFDSLGAVEFRNGLGRVTGLSLRASMVFDYPTPAAVAELVQQRMAGGGAGRRTAVDEEFDRLEALVETAGEDDAERRRIGARLQALMAKLAGNGNGDADSHAATIEMIQSATADEIVELIDKELDRS